MSQMIQIQGDLVSIIDQTVRTQISLAEFLPRIERRSPVYMPVLPTGTRAIWWDPTDLEQQTLMVLIEVEPKTILMNLNGNVSSLSLPYVRFIFIARSFSPEEHSSWRLSDYRVFMSNQRYSDADKSDMIAALLPNVYEDGRICFGSTGANANQSLADRLDETVNGFFVSTFNHDLTIRRPVAYRSYASWSKMTRQDPTEWATWEDFNPQLTPWRLTSWNYWQDELIQNTANRNDPVMANDGIPELPLGATFGRTREWIANLSLRQFERIRTTINEDIQTDTLRQDDDPNEVDDPDEIEDGI